MTQVAARYAGDRHKCGQSTNLGAMRLRSVRLIKELNKGISSEEKT
jgi:hypothetical protein